MIPTRLRAAVLLPAVALLFLPFAVSAQPEIDPGELPEEVPDAVEEMLPTPGLAAPTQEFPDEDVVGEEGILWRLRGGGEVVGRLLKETPVAVFVDIGPTVVEIPTASVVSRTPLDELTEPPETGIGMGESVFDPETGSLIFRGREDDRALLSQQEVLDQVKKGVVLVSNPGGLGTGWVLDQQGRVITNQHVTGNELYQTVTIFVKEGDQWERRRIENCRVEAASPLFDLAVVQLDMERVREMEIELHPLDVAPPASLEVGDRVFAVGNPGMGLMVLDHTVSEGIVSSLARNFNDILFIQTTAAVNPGNSGGPLVNENGEVVGVVTLKAMFREGLGFALPADYVRQFVRYSRAYALDDAARARGYRYHRPQ